MEMGEYDYPQIEKRWRKQWIDQKTFRTPSPGESDFSPDRPKYYILDMFPYTSGSGLHIGHPKGYIATDILSRYKRMRGFNVLHPMGFDSFGLPAEQFALENNVHPVVFTEENIEVISEQLQVLGLSYDWDRVIATSRPEYYKWTQWIFLQLYEAWFDPDTTWTDEAGQTQTGRARPIEDLVTSLKSGARSLSSADVESAGVEDTTDWDSLSDPQKTSVLNNYRLAYQEEVTVNWCPGLGTVLSNEEVTNDGKSERGDFPVFQRPLKQWMMRITDFADRLLQDLDAVLPDGRGDTFQLEWPDSVKRMQYNWIGRSEGGEVQFDVLDPESQAIHSRVTVFTTRPDTLFGATFMVLSPAHPLVELTSETCLIPETWAETVPASWKGPNAGLGIREAVEKYAVQAKENAMTRDVEKEKTGLFAGFYAVNPVNQVRIPVFIADYVSMDYGSGAIMAVPAHDDRDFEFANKFGLEITDVVQVPEGQETRCFTGDGTSINSGDSDNPFSISGLETQNAKASIIEALEARDRGRRAVNYKLRDWVFSRQRYWGEPFPLAHAKDGRVAPVDLPVTLPEMDDFQPDTSDAHDAPIRPPLARAAEDWRRVEVNGEVFEREYNSMPQWAGSCWYYLRFMDPHNEGAFADSELQRHFGPVDLYVGGAEHAVLHLLYARFWHKALYDLGHVSTPEPFKQLFNQGMITADAYNDDRGIYVDIRKVEFRDSVPYNSETGEKLNRNPGKMGKRYKNGLPPEEVGEEYGVDALRLYEMYMGPLDATAPWSMDGMRGMQRFLQRFWRNVVSPDRKVRIGGELTPDMERSMHRTIQRVSEDVETLRFNTAIAALIELNNSLVGAQAIPEVVVRNFLLLFAPFAPHICEEVWELAGFGKEGIAYAPWPGWDAELAKPDMIEMPVQVNGKVRARFEVAAEATREEIEQLALAQENVQTHLQGKAPRKVIVVPRRLVNIVA